MHVGQSTNMNMIQQLISLYHDLDFGRHTAIPPVCLFRLKRNSYWPDVMVNHLLGERM